MKAEPELLVELGFMLLALGALGAVAWKIGLSAVPLFLVAGLVVGNGGIVEAEAAAPFLEVAASIGVVLLLLALGLEFSAAEFTSALRRHAPSGVVDLLLNATPGVVAGLLVGLPWQASLALGGVTWISSSGIVSRTLSDLGRLAFRETPSVLSILVLEDIAMAVYLPLLGVLLAGAGLVAGLTGSAVAVASVLAFLFFTRRAAPLLGRVLTHDDDEQVLFRVLGITFVVAGVAEYLQVSSAVGAFLVGLAIPEGTARRARTVLAPLKDLFGAAFFFYFAYETAPADIVPVLPAALALAVVTAGTKVATGWYAAGRDGVGRKGRIRAGTALIARGEFSVVIAGLAITSGYFAIGPIATAYVLLLAVSGPIITRVVGHSRDAAPPQAPPGLGRATGEPAPR
jgi:CPA2 family monovalent cation:H+ antiporter-2